MKKKIILISLVLSVCGAIYGINKARTGNNIDFCDICQPQYGGSCVTYIIENTGNAGIYYCGEGVNIYDTAPED